MSVLPTANLQLTIPALIVGLFVTFGIGVYVGQSRAPTDGGSAGRPVQDPGNPIAARQMEEGLKFCYELVAKNMERCGAPVAAASSPTGKGGAATPPSPPASPVPDPTTGITLPQVPPDAATRTTHH